MKPMFSLAATALALLLTMPVSAETFRSNGKYAYGWSQNGAGVDVYLLVQTRGSGSDNATYLHYYVRQCSPFGCEFVVRGEGNVPSSVVKYAGTGAALTATVDIPDVNALPATFVRSSAPGVTATNINVTVTVSGDYVQSSSGMLRESMGTFRLTRVGETEFNHGRITGSVQGVGFVGNTYGQLGTDRNVTIIIERNR